MLIQADAFYLPFRSNYFHTLLMSPPYWGLRKYQGDQGKEPLGLEATPERHIERMVEVFREVWRVLRPDGVCWLNYGDCFASSWASGRRSVIGNPSRTNRVDRTSNTPFKEGDLCLMPHRLAIALQDDGWIVRNDLVWFKRNPMPESVSGWKWERKKQKVGRKDVDWDARPKGWQAGLGAHDQGSDSKGQYRHDEEQTEAVYEYGDDYVLRKSSWRHTRAHEYVFMLVKRPKYYCNQEAVRESVDGRWAQRRYTPTKKHGELPVHRQPDKGIQLEPVIFGNPSGRNPRSVLGGYTPALEAFHHWLMENFDFDLNDAVEQFKHEATNPTDVLDVPTAPYKGAHYATFPPKLIAPLIRSSVPRRCCPECGMAWAPVVEQDYYKHRPSGGKKTRNERGNKSAPETNWGTFGTNLRLTSTVTAYRPTCECGHEDHVPGIVLDIFGGSGTTGMVAKQLMRRWVVMDISRPYLDEQAKVRTGSGSPANALDGLPMFEEGE